MTYPVNGRSRPVGGDLLSVPNATADRTRLRRELEDARFERFGATVPVMDPTWAAAIIDDHPGPDETPAQMWERLRAEILAGDDLGAPERVVAWRVVPGVAALPPRPVIAGYGETREAFGYGATPAEAAAEAATVMVAGAIENGWFTA